MAALIFLGSAFFRTALPVLALWSASFCVIASSGRAPLALAAALASVPALMPMISGLVAGRLLDFSLFPKIKSSAFERLLAAAAFYAVLESGAVLDIILKIGRAAAPSAPSAMAINLASAVGRGFFAGGLAAALILLFVLSIEAPLRWFSRLSPAASGFKIGGLKPIIYFMVIVVLFDGLIKLFADTMDPRLIFGIIGHG